MHFLPDNNKMNFIIKVKALNIHLFIYYATQFYI